MQVVTRGSDQVEISSRFEVRNDPAVVRNFGTLLVEYCKAVPDGVVAFFPSYLYMESIVSAWNEMVRRQNRKVFLGSPLTRADSNTGNLERGPQVQAHLYRDARRGRDECGSGELQTGQSWRSGHPERRKLTQHMQACDNGRGAVLLSVARGKVSEGIDFDHNYGRAVIMFGIPYQVRGPFFRRGRF